MAGQQRRCWRCGRLARLGLGGRRGRRLAVWLRRPCRSTEQRQPSPSRTQSVACRRCFSGWSKPADFAGSKLQRSGGSGERPAASTEQAHPGGDEGRARKTWRLERHHVPVLQKDQLPHAVPGAARAAAVAAPRGDRPASACSLCGEEARQLGGCFTAADGRVWTSGTACGARQHPSDAGGADGLGDRSVRERVDGPGPALEEWCRLCAVRWLELDQGAVQCARW